jgi:hypothetical protein
MHRFNPNKLLIDPYARQLVGDVEWNEALFGYQVGSPDGDLSFDERDSARYVPKCRVIDPAFTWGEERKPNTAHGLITRERHSPNGGRVSSTPVRMVEEMVEQPGLHGRHRDKNGELSKKHGNTLVSTLRRIYGGTFAPQCAPSEKLSEVLHKLDEPSLSKLVHDHEHHKLYQLIDQSSGPA